MTRDEQASERVHRIRQKGNAQIHGQGVPQNGDIFPPRVIPHEKGRGKESDDVDHPIHAFHRVHRPTGVYIRKTLEYLLEGDVRIVLAHEVHRVVEQYEGKSTQKQQSDRRTLFTFEGVQAEQARQKRGHKEQSVADIEAVRFPAERRFTYKPIGYKHGDHARKRSDARDVRLQRLIPKRDDERGTENQQGADVIRRTQIYRLGTCVLWV